MINSKLILGIIFLLFLCQFMKCFRYDPLKIKFSKVISYRLNRAKYNLDLTKIFKMKDFSAKRYWRIYTCLRNIG